MVLLHPELELEEMPLIAVEKLLFKVLIVVPIVVATVLIPVLELVNVVPIVVHAVENPVFRLVIRVPMPVKA